MKAFQPEFFCLRTLDHDRIDHIVRMRQEWGRTLQQRNQPGSWAWVSTNITDDDVVNLHAMCEFLSIDKRDRKLVISGSWFYIYTNDVSLVQAVSSLPWLDKTLMEWTQVALISQPNTVVLKTPAHQCRTYLRSVTLDVQQKKSLRTVLESSDVRMGPALAQWFTRDVWTRTLDYHFIDHDDDGWLLMLSLVVPGIIRKTVPITQHK